MNGNPGSKVEARGQGSGQPANLLDFGAGTLSFVTIHTL